jgi:phosphate transport system permease protein
MGGFTDPAGGKASERSNHDAVARLSGREARSVRKAIALPRGAAAATGGSLKRSKFSDGAVKVGLLACAAASIAALAFIGFFLLRESVPLFSRVNPIAFAFSPVWEPVNGEFGILSFLVATLLVTSMSLALAVPIGLACGIYIAELAPPVQARVIKSATELLAGIPSVVYGLFGIAFVAPAVRAAFGGAGYGALSASLILALMTLPTIVNVTVASLKAVPRELIEGSLAMGATSWQTISKVQVPAARSGIFAGIALGMGRAVGETMAVLMVAGNAPLMPTDLLGPIRTLTMNVVTDMSYAEGVHLSALFATGVVLFVLIFAINLSVQAMLRSAERAREREERNRRRIEARDAARGGEGGSDA